MYPRIIKHYSGTTIYTAVLIKIDTHKKPVIAVYSEPWEYVSDYIDSLSDELGPKTREPIALFLNNDEGWRHAKAFVNSMDLLYQSRDVFAQK